MLFCCLRLGMSVWCPLELERVLTKLKFDEAVSGYALLTNDGQPFLSFSIPDEIVPRIKGTLEIHADSFKLANVMTNQGIVILSRVHPEWVLAVLFEPTMQLGIALQKTKDVTVLLQTVDLPPPPSPAPIPEIVPLAEPIVESVESKVESVEPEITAEMVPVEAPIEEDIPLEEIIVKHGCVVHKGPKYVETTTIDSPLNKEITDKHGHLAFDILLMVDEKRTAFKIAEALAREIERVLEILCWCVSKHLVTVECPEEQEADQIEIIEFPIFEGDLKKAKKDHRPVLELCDGSRTVHEIAQELHILYFNALQSIVPYRGKSLRFIRKDKKVEE